MMIENSLEFGCKFIAGQDEIATLLQLKELYGFNHLQIMPSDIQSLENSLASIHSVIDIYELETSVIINSSNFDIYHDYKLLFDICRRFSTKYFIVDFESDILDSDIAVYDLLKKITDVSAVNHVFTCLNLHVTTQYTENIKRFNQLGSHLKSDFFLLSVEADTTGNIQPILNDAITLNKSCGILNIRIDSKPLQFENDIYPLIDKLFWLPWKERPLVFTNPIQENFWIFQKFTDLIERGNYFYP